MSERTAMRQLPVVILSTADIDAPIWTNKQHIASRLAADQEVHYVESLGLRAPRLQFRDLSRIIARVIRRLLPNRRQAVVDHRSGVSSNGIEGICVHSPVIFPWHGFSVVRAINHKLIGRTILNRLPERYILWSFSPLIYGLDVRAEAVIYHSVDLLHAIDGVPKDALLLGERELVRRADATIASSKGVAQHLRSQGAQPLIWENVADIELFRRMREPATKRERRAIFVGNLTPGKIDFALFEAIISRGVRLALAGPISIDGTKGDPALDRLLASPLVEYLGTLSQLDMALELGRSWVGIIPYHVNNYTVGVFPMKVYEYLAAGLPVVATALPSIMDNNIPDVTVASMEIFADLVAQRCGSTYIECSGNFASNSWDSRIEQVRALLDSVRPDEAAAR